MSDGDLARLAEAAALLGLLGRATWPLFATARGVLLVQLGIGASFAAHYALLGLATAAVTGAIGAAQTLASLWLGAARRRLARRVGYGLLVCMGVGAALSWQGMPSMLAAGGLMLIAWGRLQPCPQAMTRRLLAGQVLMLAHDLVVGAEIAVLADLVGLAVGLPLMAGRSAWWRRIRAGIPGGAGLRHAEAPAVR